MHPDSISTLITAEQDTSLDDGGEVCEGNTYLPSKGNLNLVDKSYNPALKEDNGNCNDILNGLTFNYGSLNKNLSPPLNMYNGREACLCHGVLSQKFNIAFESVQICNGVDNDSFKRNTANYGKDPHWMQQQTMRTESIEQENNNINQESNNIKWMLPTWAEVIYEHNKNFALYVPMDLSH